MTQKRLIDGVPIVTVGKHHCSVTCPLMMREGDTCALLALGRRPSRWKTVLAFDSKCGHHVRCRPCYRKERGR